MNAAIDGLSNSILKKPLQECSEDELLQLTQQYPFFGPMQLLLAKKLSEQNSARFANQVQTTSLYFPNRIWLQYLLNDGDVNSNIIDQPVKEVAAEQTLFKPVPDDPMKIESNQSETDYQSATSIPGVITEASPEIHSPVNEAFVQDGPEENISPEINHDSGDVQVNEQTVTQDELQPVNDLPSGEQITQQQPMQENKEPGMADETTGQQMPEQPKALFDPVAFKIERIAAGTSLMFEPYHTVDYFASQGIKFREDDKPKDKFGQQLKSFTEWLKTLKKMPANEVIAASSEPGTDKKVEQMAEFSVAERHVITEAMAEVWIKQGNRQKAEEIYQKLSLLDPSKSSYFAAKIEDLKKTS